ncbi:hypothetical protein MAR_033058 [Mya arenaria]|uniref:Phorbol-ester/DAG-type domain-containing protein n=1 Tax=Mya arenaria TaxID=6604 RepID=A0ABY7GBN5_MYAAR|nr:hypothetical protein MAR_033058 [Mya arenaria]
MIDDLCIMCRSLVRPKQKGKKCISCGKKQHEQCLEDGAETCSFVCGPCEENISERESCINIDDIINEPPLFEISSMKKFSMNHQFWNGAFRRARPWYLDGTFKVRKVIPFSSGSTFLRSGVYKKQRFYKERYWVVKSLLALPFLPPQHIESAFRRLREKATTPKLEILCEYIDHQWMFYSCWTVREWSCYRQSVRTNNDCGGWHIWINCKAGRSNLQFYVLVPLLQREAETVGKTNTACVRAHLVPPLPTVYREIDVKLQDLWSSFDDG